MLTIGIDLILISSWDFLTCSAVGAKQENRGDLWEGKACIAISSVFLEVFISWEIALLNWGTNEDVNCQAYQGNYSVWDIRLKPRVGLILCSDWTAVLWAWSADRKYWKRLWAVLWVVCLQIQASLLRNILLEFRFWPFKPVLWGFLWWIMRAVISWLNLQFDNSVITSSQ